MILQEFSGTLDNSINKLIRTNSENKDFQKLVAELDDELRILDGDEHVFYALLNKTDHIRHVIVAYENDLAVGIGSIRAYSDEITEIKRMYVLKSHREKGIASNILAELERWAKELQYNTCILETGKNQPAAIRLYQKNNYKIISNFGNYINVANSVCFEKKLSIEN